MVVKYGNIILLMETLINGTCYKVSTDVLYGLGVLHHYNLPVYTSSPSKWLTDVEEATRKGMDQSNSPKNGNQSQCDGKQTSSITRNRII